MNLIKFLLIYITISLTIDQATNATTVVCPFAHFLTAANTCVQCLTTCSKCKNLQGPCQGCAEGFKLSFDNAKCNACKIGELTCQQNQILCQRYYAKQNQQCKPLCIVQNCRTCSSIFAKVCEVCLNGYKISADGTSCIQQKSTKVSSVQHRHLQQTNTISNSNSGTRSTTSTSTISSSSINPDAQKLQDLLNTVNGPMRFSSSSFDTFKNSPPPTIDPNELIRSLVTGGSFTGIGVNFNTRNTNTGLNSGLASNSFSNDLSGESGIRSSSTTTSTNNLQSLGNLGIGSTSPQSITSTSTMRSSSSGSSSNINSNSVRSSITRSTSSIGTNLSNNNSPTNLESTTNINNLRPNTAGQNNINTINRAQLSNLNLPSSLTTNTLSRTSTTTSNSRGGINQPSLNINSNTNTNTNSGTNRIISSIIGIQPPITTSSSTSGSFGSNTNAGTTFSTDTGTGTATSTGFGNTDSTGSSTSGSFGSNTNAGTTFSTNTGTGSATSTDLNIVAGNNTANKTNTISSLNNNNTSPNQTAANTTSTNTTEEVPSKIVVINRQCSINQFDDPLSGCLPCNSKCATCIRTADQCLECQSNRTMIGWKCVTNQHLLYNISLGVPKGQQDYALGEGINQFKKNFVQSVLPGAPTSLITLNSAKLDSTKNILYLSGIVDKFGNTSITTLSNDIATKLKNNKNLGIFEVLNSSIAAQTDLKPPTNDISQVATNTNIADDVSKKGPNLAAIIVPSVIGGLILIYLLICGLCYCRKCCCFKEKQNQAKLNKNMDTQRKFQQNKMQNIMPPTTGLAVPASTIISRPITPITPIPIGATHIQTNSIKKISQIKQEPIPLIIPTSSAEMNNKIEQMKIDIKNKQQLKINEAHKIDKQGGTNISKLSVKKITPIIAQMGPSNTLNIIQRPNNTISNKGVQNIAVINNQNIMENISNLKNSNINNQIFKPNTNTSKSSHVNNQIIIPRVANHVNTSEGYTYINTYGQLNGGTLRNQQLIAGTIPVTTTILTTPAIQATTSESSRQIQYINNNKNVVNKNTVINQQYHPIIVTQKINTNIPAGNLLITTNQQHNGLYDNQYDNQFNKQYYYQQNKNINVGQSGNIYITSNQTIMSPSRDISYQTISSQGTIPLLPQQTQKVQRKLIQPTSSKLIQGQAVSYLTGNITKYSFRDGKIVTQHISSSENLPDYGFTHQNKIKYQYGNKDANKITKMYGKQQSKDLGTQGLTNQTQFYQIKQQHYDQGWKYEDKKN